MTTLRNICLSLVLMSACAPSPIEIEKASKTSDWKSSFGHKELNQASDEFAKNPQSPLAYAEFHKQVHALQSIFAEHISKDANRRLIFSGIEILRKYYPRPIREQFLELSTTVWPVVLGNLPKPKQKPWAFAEHLCREKIILNCQQVVHEKWPNLLHVRAWQRFVDRAQELYAVCKQCSFEKTYKTTMEKLQHYTDDINMQAEQLQIQAHPKNWPYAGDHAKEWPKDISLLEFHSDGSITLNNEQVGKAWHTHTVLAKHRHDAETLGLHLKPSVTVQFLRRTLEPIKKAGYKFVILQARNFDSPFVARGYLLKLDARPIKVAVHAQDSIQTLIEMLDNAN